MSVERIITENLDIWTSAIKTKSASGRGSSNKLELYGIKKLRELILDLAVRGKLVPQDPTDEPIEGLLARISAEKEQLIKDKIIKKQKLLPPVSEVEKPFKLPNGWSFERLGSIMAKITDGTHHSPTNGEHGDYLYITAKNIKESGIQLTNATYVSAEVHQEIYSRCNPEKGDVLYIKDGATTGITTINDISQPFSMLSSVALLKPTCGILNKYLLYTLRSPFFYNEMRAGMTGVAITRVTLKKLENAFITLPSIEEQRRIVDKVDELMVLCDKLESQTEASIEAHQTLVKSLLETLTNAKDAHELNESWQRISAHFDVLFTTEDSIDQLKQTILQLAVMGKLVKQDPNDEPASKLLERIAAEKEQLIKDKKIKKQKPLPSISEDEKPFGIPNTWCWTRLGDIYSFLNGFAFKSHWFCDNGIKLLRNINIGHGETRWIEKACIPFEMRDEFENFELAEGDIVISLDRPIINTGLKYAIINQSDLPCLLLQRVAKFHSIGDRVSTPFLSKWLETDTFISSIDPGRSNGVPHISTKQLEMTLFPLIPENEQLEIVRKANEMLGICDSLKFKLASATSTQVKIVDVTNG